MKKISVIISAAAMLFGVASCQKGGEEPKGFDATTGKVTITINPLDKDVNSRAYAVSTNKPTTTWSGNIHNLTLFLVQSGTIKVARAITVPSATDNTQKPFVFNNVPAGTYEAYLIANHAESDISSDFTATTVNQPVSKLLMKLVENTAWPEKKAGDGTAKAYNQPAEIFLALQTGITVAANTNTTVSTPFTLKRAISLMRFRINRDHPSASVDNTGVKFDDPACDIRVRKTGKSVDHLGTIAPVPAAVTDLIYAKGFNTTGVPASGYKDGTSILAAGQYAWQDVRIFPGGALSTDPDGTKKFNIVISGMAPAGYVPAGAASPLLAPSLVYWQGTVGGVVVANDILELNIDLISAGWPDVPGVLETGELNITVGLMEWGNIGQVDVPVRK